MKSLIPSLLAPLILILGCSDESTVPTSDGTPPGAVTDLAVRDSSSHTVTLTWTAPGDDGTEGQAARYDLRRSQSLLTEAGWEAATVADSSMVPKIAGLAETLTVEGLVGGAWFFALKAADEVPNWSALSNVAGTMLVDSVAPGAIADLAVVSVTASSVELSWTAPGDDGETGQAAEYDLRYALAEITEEAWESATQVEGEPAPSVAGTSESFTITGLEVSRLYYFALKTTDGAGNWSVLSNVVSGEPAVRLVQLTFSPGAPDHTGASEPAWSPDGEWIVFLADWNSENYWKDLYLIPATGGTAVRLADDPDTVMDPSWSPDGTRIAFVTDLGNGQAIYIRIAWPDAMPVEVIRPGVQISACAWSPVDDRIAYVLNHYPTPSWQIYTIPHTGGTPDLLFTSQDRIFGTLAWSPDGTRIAFPSYQNENYDIWVTSAGGGDLVQVTDDPGNDTWPVWSPDGSQIAFSSRRSGSGNIWLVAADGGEPVQLTFHTGETGAPVPHSWSPDGTRIAVTIAGEVGGTPCNDIWILYFL
jgi:WD40 repeat protein